MTRRSMLLLVLGTVLCTAASSAELEDSVPQLAGALADLSADSSVVDLPEGLYTIESTWVILQARSHNSGGLAPEKPS